MIGVVAELADREVVTEFFELFKTPWEFYRRDRKYDIVLCAGEGDCDAQVKLLIVYSSMRIRFDDQEAIKTGRQRKQACILLSRGSQTPIYGGTLTFSDKSVGLLTDEDTKECVAYKELSGDRALIRIGYDLFSEVRTLLTVGQPPANANLPTLELHIAFLRDLIIGCGVSLVEIPPVPDGFAFLACLTHDVDHPSIRQHKWDHTMFGFLYRAVFGSLIKLCRGELSFHDLLLNWSAALRLPFIHVGLAKDFWLEFAERYLELEKGISSTFFIIPFSGQPGSSDHGSAPRRRASRYGADDIADTIQRLMAAGCEVGLHGIDAWLDNTKGCQELGKIRQFTGVNETGVRMHWLYYNEQSPVTLEASGASYDSTVGYNQTVGYRAGTTQVYKPADTDRLLELPLHAMDTALFYPSYLHMSPRQANAVLRKLADNAVRFGGTLTVNWHDRSLSPERLWGQCYRELIQDLRSRGAWFSTAGQAVSWFRKRRSAVFNTDSAELGTVGVKIPGSMVDGLPGLRLRIYNPSHADTVATHSSLDYWDKTIAEGAELISPPGIKQ